MKTRSFPTVGKIEIFEEIDDSKVVNRERDYSGDYDDETTWDYYDLEDGRRCVYRNGFFWEWLEGGSGDASEG